MTGAFASRRRVVVFDLGGVLLDWDPRHLYRKLSPGNDPAMEAFLADVCTREWNEDSVAIVSEPARHPFPIARAIAARAAVASTFVSTS
jgi:hypothetical protein